MCYAIIDEQFPHELEGYESSLKDVVERLLSFHSIDNDMELWDIYMLLDMGWSISIPNKDIDLTYKLVNKYKQGKGARQFKKLAKKYTKIYYS